MAQSTKPRKGGRIQVKALANNRAELRIYDFIGAGWFDEGITPTSIKSELDGFGEVNAIDVYINSPGGSVFDGIGIFNLLQAHGAEVTVHIDGIAASIASVIAMAASPGRLFMADNAMLMIHNPWTIEVGEAADFRKQADVLDKIKLAVMASYQRAGIGDAELSSMMDAETWMTAAEARELGFADAITEPSEEPETASARFDLSRFVNAAKAFPTKPAQSPGTNDEVSNMTPEQIEAARKEAAKLAVENAQKAEKDRRSEIREAFGSHKEAHRDLLDECLEDSNVTAAQASKRLLDALGSEATPTAGRTAPRIAIVQDQRDKIVAGVSNSVLARSGIEKITAGNEFAGMGLGSLIRDSLKRAGVPGVDRLERNALASKYFDQGMISTSDFSISLAAVANKTLRAAYDRLPITWDQWVGKTSVPDFKPINLIALGSFGNLETIPEGGEYKAGTFGEGSETGKAATKGKQLVLSRQAIINDDLGIFVRRADMMGYAAKRSVNADVYAQLALNSGAGPTMGDGGAFFNATAETTVGGHANLISSGTALSSASLGVAYRMMAVHKELNGNDVIGLRPKVLLVPLSLEQTAYTLLNSTSEPSVTSPNTANYARSLGLTVISDPLLDAISTTGWYLFADKNIAPAFEVLFLDGNETPYTDEAVDWDTDAIKYKVRLDYGVAAVDWRAGVKNAGA